jgi:hypothetical protein|tara:strand:+ start:101 stop:439 length:339 start_codon:yes stop_codon:yes gene_type:complete
MKQKSRTAKGRYLQNIVKEKIVTLFPVLTKKDIRTSMNGENSADIKLLSHTAKKLFPYSVECKNRNDFRGIYNAFKQARNHSPREPILVIKMNREKPLAIIDLDHFFELLSD